MADTIASKQTLTLDLPPSCIEFCPAHPAYFIVGTYDLQKDGSTDSNASRPQTRNGSIIVFRLEASSMHPVHTSVQSSAVLDVHFQLVDGRQDIFAVASSTATLTIYRLCPIDMPAETGAEILERISVIRIPGVDEDVLFLSCAWHPTLPDVVAVTLSTGSVYVLGLPQYPNQSATAVSPIIAHSLEAWTVAFSPMLQHILSNTGEERGTHDDATVPTNPNNATDSLGCGLTIFSGGDDSALRHCLCTLPAVPDKKVGQVPCQALFGPVKIAGHEAGVTAVLPLSITLDNGDWIVLTGSYDDHVRVYSIRSLLDTGGTSLAKCLASENLGGGVWRLKLIRQTFASDGRSWACRVLASCMHAGVRVLDVIGYASGLVCIEVVARFEEHQSMNYGSDFQPNSSLTCISTSFYDRRLCLWTVKSTSD